MYLLKTVLLLSATLMITSCKLISDPAEWHAVRGRKFLEKEKNERAIKHFEKALDKNPGHIDALLDRAIALREISKYDESLKEFRSLLQNANQNPGIVYFHLSIYYSEQLEFVRALSLVDSAIAVDPADIDYYSWKAFYLFKIGNLDESITLHKYVVLKQQDASALEFIGEAYYKKRDYQQALSYFLKSKEDGQKGYSIYLNLAWANAQLNNGTEACRYYKMAEKSLEKDETIPDEWVMFCK